MSINGPLMIDVAGLTLTPQDQELLRHPLVGGFILFTRNFNNKKQLIDLIVQIRKERPGIIIAADYEGGRVQRFREQFTRLPTMRSLGHAYTQNPALACEMAANIGWLIANELGEVGIDLPFTPVVDIDRDCCTVIGDRAFHRDPGTVAELAVALQSGLREAGMVATAKHFPGHGAVSADSHAELPVDERDWAALQEDIAPYRELIAHGLASVMMAHIRYPAVDAQPASLSAHWIKAILRKKLAFEGAVICDDLSMGGAAVAGSYAERARLALAAGCDILPVCNNRAGVLALLDELSVADDTDSARRRPMLKRQVVDANDPKRRLVTLAQIQQLLSQTTL